ncbi:MAG: 5-(carboxyamino)imidazole ribonucleotide mutase [Planctomycetota bacterium]|jgi:5-(carboxyamino)imidazole ribonucleotide mutase|nr:5-(carboxyamino)imidazole ribonucleotide mutase [Planctomycetota bacterium]
MQPQVALIMGSYSDFSRMERALEVFKEFGIRVDVRVMSAHRTPDVVAEYAKKAEQEGVKVIIAAAGGAAHLPGVIASYTVLPVIGIPVAIPSLNGLDSLLSMSQMPAGIPVAVMSTGEGGAENAALMAIAILATADAPLAEMLHTFRRRMADKVIERDSTLQWKLRAKEQEHNQA